MSHDASTRKRVLLWVLTYSEKAGTALLLAPKEGFDSLHCSTQQSGTAQSSSNWKAPIAVGEICLHADSLDTLEFNFRGLTYCLLSTSGWQISPPHSASSGVGEAWALDPGINPGIAFGDPRHRRELFRGSPTRA